jgi:hypothetical protein
MNMMTALQELADRLGLLPASHRTADGRPRLVFLAIAGLASLALWTVIGWGLWRLVVWLGQT